MGAFMALRELQIAPEIVTIAFTLTLAAIALAAALAFGLGSRNVAGQVTQQWYDRQASTGNGTAKDVQTQTWPGPGPRPVVPGHHPRGRGGRAAKPQSRQERDSPEIET